MNFLDQRLPERFWAKCIPEPNSGCWLWLAGATRGYGQFGATYKGAPSRLVHRLTYETEHGQVPGGAQLDHRCRERSCCNPNHLEVVSPAENTRRGLLGDLKKLCAQGHTLTAANLKVRRDGPREYRRCRECANAIRRERRRKRRQL